MKTLLLSLLLLAASAYGEPMDKTWLVMKAMDRYTLGELWEKSNPGQPLPQGYRATESAVPWVLHGHDVPLRRAKMIYREFLRSRDAEDFHSRMANFNESYTKLEDTLK